jgi:long-chain acyl-CoA synthetase
MARLARLFDSIQARGGQKCLHCDGRWHTYAELGERIVFWRRRLIDLALAKGSVVGLEADYSLDAIALLLSAWAEQLIVALVPRGGDREVCLTDSSAAGHFLAPATGLPVWSPRSAQARHPLLDRLTAAGDPGVILFTSGSTGRAKAALHSVDRFLHKFDRPGRALRTLAFLHFDHVAGVDTLLYTLVAGGALVVPSDRAAAAICALIEAAEVEVLSTSPSFLRLLWASGAADGRNLSSLAVITYGSEPMDAGTLRRVNELFPKARISQKYGTTETGAPRTISRSNDSLWVQIADDGVETQVREGILWIRSEGTFLGYLNAPTPFDDDGWYCTGDLVEQDGEWLRILGREGDTINVGGEKVSPVEVEQVILELDEVVAAAVSGRAHPLMGQIVTARVSLRPGVDEAKAETLVRRHCRSRLPRHKVPVTVDVAKGTLSSDRQKILRNADRART